MKRFAPGIGNGEWGIGTAEAAQWATDFSFPFPILDSLFPASAGGHP